ncbi:23S rRNA (uracil(747)-C(5))-methyltransferase RlmC [Shewanella avicenniae]|uniref:23S rRNA (uracil(747)-C(5))-methyltransferase RlmC n=1 Tax=Shewanella avicenniae TaxID=2814294 RepID=A0ABX7QP34_9GAMM|nr:23S rRNA (uracil(747)-C(5))-methyltransferase RlmC [Shewanella avicenniae]QSX33019.1 23S rRNA (uracil(747)-C(5))-methyltransferase RlmC [Shewanella avicenniae]
MNNPSPCQFFQQGKCQSCQRIEMPLAEQLQHKQQQLQQLLTPFAISEWLAPVAGPELAFRNKAKMVALGAAHQPILGIVSPSGEAVSLVHCPLYPASMQSLLARLEPFIQHAGIPPYRVDKAKGELKFILLTQAHCSGEFMLRFVLRSEQAIPRIERELPALLAEFPKIKLVTANIQPVHMARLEGEQEIWLHGEPRLREVFNDIPLYIRPKSFFQTNPEVAAQLYAAAKAWLAPLKLTRLWDLFCGVGGFGLHCADKTTQLTGIEIEPEAIACARLSAEELGLEQVEFNALDSTSFADEQSAGQVPDLVIVNPPRRGLGQALSIALNQFAPNYILYSSCNPQTLAADLGHLQGYATLRAQLFDMFPHTDHYEVLVLLQRKSG